MELFAFILTYRADYSSNEPLTISDLLSQRDHNVGNSMEESRAMDSSDSEIDIQHVSEKDTEHDLEFLPAGQTQGRSTSRAVILENQRCELFYLN